MIGAFGPCQETRIEVILTKYFAGKVLVINGEAYGNLFLEDKNVPENLAPQFALPTKWWKATGTEKKRRKCITSSPFESISDWTIFSKEAKHLQEPHQYHHGGCEGTGLQ